MKFWKKRTIEPYEEIEYEPLTVLEMLTEMKDLSELMTSLAYSALVLDSDPLADEVSNLGDRMDFLKYQLRLQATLSVRNKDEAAQVAGILQLADASSKIADASAQMVELLDANVKLRPFLSKMLDEADDRVALQTVPDDSRADGATLGELRLESETGVRVLAIRRGKSWIYNAGGETKLRAGDSLLIRGQREGAQHFGKWLQGKEEEL